jgi:hypothetical protein
MGGGAASCVCGQYQTKCCPASINATACDGELACAGTKCGCVIEYQAGYGSGLALRTDGTIWKESGSNVAMQAYVNAYRQVVSMSGAAPLRVSTTAPSQLAVSGYYQNSVGCAIVAGGEVNCFPLSDNVMDSTFLGAGLGTTDVTAFPVPVVTDTTNLTHLANIVQISGGTSGNTNFCAVDTGGSVWCWGYGQDAELGYGDKSNVNHARRVKANASTDFAGAAEVRIGYDSTCARKTDGTVWCWGYDYYWELGVDRATTEIMVNGYYSDYPRVVPILTGKSTKLLAGPLQTFCTIMDDTTVVCWGQNTNAEAGALNDNMHQQVPPTTVTVGAGQGALTGIVEIASGYYSICAKTKAPDFAIICWGNYNQMNGSQPYPIPFKDSTQTAVTGVRSPLSSGYARELGYVDPNGLVTNGTTTVDLAHNPPCSNLILPDGGIMP